MTSDSDLHEKVRNSFSSLLNFLEALPYFLLGTFVACSIIVAVALWGIEYWSQGEYQLAALMISMVSVSLISLIFSLHKKRRVLFIGAALCTLGSVSYVVIDLFSK